jgi:hypothetical protein
MQQRMQPRPNTMNSQPAHLRLRRHGFLETLVPGLAFSAFAFLVVPAILGGKHLLAQTNVTQAATSTQQQKAAARHSQPQRRAAAHAHAASAQRPPASEAIAPRPPVSQARIVPANQIPNQATVTWDSRGLEIEASNSSLNQILHQVAADTGAKLEGLTQDQRVFGTYGPGPGRDVLLKLLDGSGYNVLMIGGRAVDAPLEIVLSARLPASPQTAANNQNRSNSKSNGAREPFKPDPPPDYTAEAQPPQPIQNPFGIGEPSREPQELMQEILQRQQKIDQQQEQQNNPQQ